MTKLELHNQVNQNIDFLLSGNEWFAENLKMGVALPLTGCVGMLQWVLLWQLLTCINPVVYMGRVPAGCYFNVLSPTLTSMSCMLEAQHWFMLPRLHLSCRTKPRCCKAW